MEKLITILSMLTLISCGQENIANTISEIEENFGEVRVVIVDEATPESEETPYYHEVADDQVTPDNTTPSDDSTQSSEEQEQEYASDEETTDNEEDSTHTIQNYETRTATIFRTKDGNFKIVNESNKQLYFSTISEEAKSEIFSWSFPHDAYTSKITYLPVSKFDSFEASILDGHNLGHIAEVKIIEEVSNVERETPADATAYCGLVFIDQTPLEQGTKPIYVENNEDGKTYRIHNSGFTGNIPQMSSSMIAHYDLLLELESIESKSTTGCIYTNDDYYFNYELPEYRRVINVESFNIGW